MSEDTDPTEPIEAPSRRWFYIVYDDETKVVSRSGSSTSEELALAAFHPEGTTLELVDEEFNGRPAKFIDGEIVDVTAESLMGLEERAFLVDHERDRRLAAGFEFQGATFQARQKDLVNLAGATLAASMALASGAQVGDLRWSSPDVDFAWIAADNALVPMDAQTVIGFGLAAMAFQSRMIMSARAIKDAIIAGGTPPDITDDALWGA